MTADSSIYRYVIDHDMGFSPNPFHGYCTLANCKPEIRRGAKIGDFVLGFGSAKSRIRGRLIFWMLVNEKIEYNKYWGGIRFQEKKPIINGSHIVYHGDNIYHQGHNGDFIQEHSFHSMPDGEVNPRNLKTDTSRTTQVLIAKEFGYYGKNALLIPPELIDVIAKGRGHRRHLKDNLKRSLQDWLLSATERGFRGEPSGWANIK